MLEFRFERRSFDIVATRTCIDEWENSLLLSNEDRYLVCWIHLYASSLIFSLSRHWTEAFCHLRPRPFWDSRRQSQEYDIDLDLARFSLCNPVRRIELMFGWMDSFSDWSACFDCHWMQSRLYQCTSLGLARRKQLDRNAKGARENDPSLDSIFALLSSENRTEAVRIPIRRYQF